MPEGEVRFMWAVAVGELTLAYIFQYVSPSIVHYLHDITLHLEHLVGLFHLLLHLYHTARGACFITRGLRMALPPPPPPPPPPPMPKRITQCTKA